jgi:RNA methyltransferase, TrmH family
MITSLQNEKIKLAHALQTAAKSRRKEGKIALEGVRLVKDALLAGHQPLFALVTEDNQQTDLLALLRSRGVDPQPVSTEVMRHISDTQQPQGIVAVFNMPAPALPPQPRRILILDSIRDPGNMGTILRTAAAAGVQAVLLSPTCADPFNPKALRGGMGAHFRVPLLETAWEHIAEYCYNLQIYIADSAGDVRYDKAEWSAPWALIIGSEAHGGGSEARRLAQQRIFIPMAVSTESLNAAVAAGVILFEAMRPL